MGASEHNFTLHPLGIGEIFDRAITLFARNYRVFLLFGLVAAVPTAIFSYAYYAEAGTTYATIVAFSGNLILVACHLVTRMATTVTVGQIYQRSALDLRAALKSGVWNIPGALGSGITLSVVFLAPALILCSSISVLLRLPGPAVMGFSVLLLPISAIAVAMSDLTVTMAMATLTIEDCRTSDAIGRTLSRVLAGGEFRTSMLIALCLLVVQFVGGLAAGFLGPWLYRFTQSVLPYQVLVALVQLIVDPLVAILVTVYYFDIRIRREAFDLDMSLDGLEASAP